jgi:polysaccharide biosynthesis/export protein
MQYRLLRITSLFFLILIGESCVPAKKVKYFNDIEELPGPNINPRIQKPIAPFDRLYIKVLSTDPETNRMFSTEEEVRTGTSAGSGGIIGYTVDENGNITFPFAGAINLATLTLAQASEKLATAISEYLPHKLAVTTKYVDNQVTVMGEVQRQGVYNFTRDKINIYEAIGLGGGITRYGDRKNVVLTRQVGEKIMRYRLNLSDSKIASKEYYYILPNDVLIVEPLKTISSSYQNITYTTILTSITTLIAVLIFTGVQF